MNHHFIGIGFGIHACEVCGVVKSGDGNEPCSGKREHEGWWLKSAHKDRK